MVKGGKKVSSQQIKSGENTQKLEKFFTTLKGRKFEIAFIIPDGFWDNDVI